MKGNFSSLGGGTNVSGSGRTMFSEDCFFFLDFFSLDFFSFDLSLSLLFFLLDELLATVFYSEYKNDH